MSDRTFSLLILLFFARGRPLWDCQAQGVCRLGVLLPC